MITKPNLRSYSVNRLVQRLSIMDQWLDWRRRGVLCAGDAPTLAEAHAEWERVDAEITRRYVSEQRAPRGFTSRKARGA